MADKVDNGNYKSRLILAPHPWPILPQTAREGIGEVFYLSWAGWELYLSRRLGLKPHFSAPQPLLLADTLNPELDFQTIDQLVKRTSWLGTGTFNFEAGHSESLFTIIDGISHYGSDRQRELAQRPFLDDRSYLALWAISEFWVREGEQALAQAASKQSRMWSLLKGQDQLEAGGPEAEAGPVPGEKTAAPLEADRRALYAWACWQRLAADLISYSDEIIPTINFPVD